MGMADKALWEQEALAEVRKGMGRRLGESGSRISKCQCPEKMGAPGTLFCAVFCLFLTPNSQSLIYDYIFQINPFFSGSTYTQSITLST